MTNFEKLKAAFPLIDTRTGRIKLLCPVDFLGGTFCLKHEINGKGMLPREVYDNQTATCVSCANAYWAFDEDDPSLTKISVMQIAAINVTDDDTYARVQHCCDQYRKGAIPFETLKELLDVLNFTVVKKKTSFMETIKESRMEGRSIPRPEDTCSGESPAPTPQTASGNMSPKSEDPIYPRQSGRERF